MVNFSDFLESFPDYFGKTLRQKYPKINGKEGDDDLVQVNFICPACEQFYVPDLDDPGPKVFNRFLPAHSIPVFEISVNPYFKKIQSFGEIEAAILDFYDWKLRFSFEVTDANCRLKTEQPMIMLVRGYRATEWQ